MTPPPRGEMPEIQSRADSSSGEKSPLNSAKISNFQARLITAIISALLTLAVTCYGGTVFVLFCLCIGAAVLYEWNDITKCCVVKRGAVCAWLFYALFAATLLASPLAAPEQLSVFAVLGIGLFAVYAAAWRAGRAKAAICQASGLFYAALFPLSFACLRAGGSKAVPAGTAASVGLYWVLLLYIIVWASDVGAYVFGRSFGGPKLAPKISPNKTCSGAAGGLLCAVLAALCYVYFAENSFAASIIMPEVSAHYGIFSPLWVIFAALLLSLISQAGDLLESWFKRLFGVKDSGRLLPGHGGIMDRIDGLLPACAVFVVFLNLFYR